MTTLFNRQDAAAMLSRVENDVTRRVVEGQFLRPELSARAIVELETKFPDVQFKNTADGVYFRVFLSEIETLTKEVGLNK